MENKYTINILDFLSSEQINSVLSQALYDKIISMPNEDVLKLLKNFKDKINKFPESTTLNECNNSNSIKEKEHDEDYYVYAFINDDWDGAVFYVGKGKGNRYKDYSKRSQHCTAILQKYNCRSEIIKAHLTEDEAYKKERYYKKQFRLAGMPIIDYENSQYNKEAQREGINKAKREGKYKGRNAVTVPNFGQYYDAYMTRQTSKSQLAKQLDISRPTLDRLIKEYENTLN